MKKKKRAQYSYVQMPHYQAWVIGLIGWDKESAEKFINKKYGVSEEIKTEGRCLLLEKSNGLHAVITVAKHPNKIAQTACVAHECLHACLLILKQIGQGISTDDHEHLTYMFQYVFQGIMENKK